MDVENTNSWAIGVVVNKIQFKKKWVGESINRNIRPEPTLAATLVFLPSLGPIVYSSALGNVFHRKFFDGFGSSYVP